MADQKLSKVIKTKENNINTKKEKTSSLKRKEICYIFKNKSSLI